MSGLKKFPVPFLNLQSEFDSLQSEWLQKIRTIGTSGMFILGPEVKAFEKEFAEYVGAPHAISVANGTDALILSLLALDIGAGDEVITTPYSFFATAEAISRVGAIPVFVDIDPVFFNLDTTKVEQAISAKTKAILPVHLFGCPMDMNALATIAEQHGLAIIEDCAQAFGAISGKQRVGACGDFGCFSFYPTKILGCYGDGGIITVKNEAHLERIVSLRNHGAKASFVHDKIGYNSRLDEIQAALLRIKLPMVDEYIGKRLQVVRRYHEAFSGTDVKIPLTPDWGQHVFNLYTIRSDKRDRIHQALKQESIGFNLCYPKPFHLQEVYEYLGYRLGDLPVVEQASLDCISLPIYPDMPESHVDRVVDVVLAA